MIPKMRAWCEPTNTMIDVTKDNIVHIIEHPDEYDVMVSTGFTDDRMEKDIFANDILLLHVGPPEDDGICYCYVNYMNATFWVGDKNKCNVMTFGRLMKEYAKGKISSIEIIGDIYKDWNLIWGGGCTTE